jgi:MoaA/NifB/PqqE/SkfB family radical SAM enzyme
MGRVDIKLGYSCNDACVHCVVDDYRDLLRSAGREQDRTTEQFKAELLESRARADSVVFTGGEPTIRQDLVELLEYARDLGYEIIMQSNGRRFHSPEFADSVVAAARVRYCIALHGPDATVHDAVTRRPGAFEQTVAGIRNLVERRQLVTGKIVISRLNMEALPRTAQAFLDLGVGHVSIAFLHAQGMARKMWDEVVPRYRDVVPFMHQAMRVLLDGRGGVDAETFMYCHMQGYEQYIGENQQQLEKYVELHQYGDSREVQDWSIVRPQIKRKFDACKSCRFGPICEGPWCEYAERYGGEEFVPVRGAPVRNAREVLDGSFRNEFAFLRILPVGMG